jgi:glycerate dehydrogenase
MKIVVLDGHALNPGDLSWANLEKLGSCTVYDRTLPAETVSRAAVAEIVLTNKTLLPREIIERLPRLRYIGVLATGYNVVDVRAARERNIPVTNVPDYATASVVQMVFAHLLNLTLHVADHGHGVAEGRWSRSEDFAYWDFPLIELAGLTLGIIGFGRIGRATAEAARGFGMNVLAYDVSPPAEQPDHVRFVGLEELFRRSDAVSLHCPLTADTQRLINAERLSWMKSSAVLINTGRGPLVDERALAEALNAGRIAGAGLDVLSIEPPPNDHPLLRAKNCCITPHIAWATAAARKRLLDTVVANVRAFLAGRPQNVVNAM